MMYSALCSGLPYWHAPLSASLRFSTVRPSNSKPRVSHQWLHIYFLADYNSRHESYPNDARDHQMGQKEKWKPIQRELLWYLYNKLQWLGHVMRREVESTLRVAMKLKVNGKRPRGRPRLMWLDNIDIHLNGENTSLKEVLETKCLENRQDWRALISRSTDRSSGEDPWAPTWSMVSIWWVQNGKHVRHLIIVEWQQFKTSHLQQIAINQN